MKAYNKHIGILILVCVFCSAASFAQGEEQNVTAKVKKKGAFNEPAEESAEVVEDSAPAYYRNHKDLPTFFNGFAIELIASDKILRRDHDMFEKFGSVYVSPSGKGGYSYVIIGFKSEKSAQSFLENVVIHHAPKARVVEYKQGKRK